MGHLIETGDECWKHYFGYSLDLPTEEELSTIKTIIFSGSGYSVYEENVSWIPVVQDYIRTIIRDYPNIKLIGGCFGEQIIAQALGGKVEKMPHNPHRESCLGRELINMTDDFFQQAFAQRYMGNNGLTQETFPKMVLQESHGDHVAQLPEGGILLGSSESCNVEFYCIGERVFCF